jgi:hypothetical protein
LSFLDSAGELKPEWFSPSADGTVENIRVADQLLIDVLFAANGQTYESLQPYVREITVDATPVKVLNIDGLIMTKTDYREKDLLDKRVLSRIKQRLSSE